jgi:hypothetical protein
MPRLAGGRVILGSGGGTFTAAMRSSLKLHLDAQTLSTITKDGSDLVSSWADKSGNGNHAAITAPFQPTYSATGISGTLPAINFPSGKLLAVPDIDADGAGFALYCVFQRDTDNGTTDQVVVRKFAVDRSWQMIVVGATDRVAMAGSELGSATDYVATSAQTADLGTAVIAHGGFNLSKLEVGVNNANYATTTAAAIFDNTSSIYLGATSGAAAPLLGSIGEVLLFNRPLTATEHAQVLNYLAARWDISITTPNVRPVYVLSGQSNAVGQAPEADMPANLEGETFSNFEIYNTGASAWQALQPGVNDLGATNCFGPESEFGRLANAVFDASNKGYLIKYASPGKHLANDDLTNSFYPLTGTYWTNLAGYIDAAMNALRNAGVLAEIRGYLWMQGESDAATGNQAYADAYEANLTYFIGQLRAYTYARGFSGPQPVFVAPQIGATASVPYRATVRAAQVAVAASVPGVVTFDTAAYGFESDNIHFSAAGQVSLGGDFFTRMF